MLLFGFVDNQQEIMIELALAALHRWILVAKQQSSSQSKLTST
jgi:hypothetical protein